MRCNCNRHFRDCSGMYRVTFSLNKSSNTSVLSDSLILPIFRM